MEDTDVEAQLRLKASYWRQEAKRFAGRPEEAWCLDYAQHAETLAECVRLDGADCLKRVPGSPVAK